MIEYKGKQYICHLDLAMSFISSKWKSVILCHINCKPRRFLELQRSLNGISQKVLNEKLKELEEDGLISKTIYPEVPPKVEFRLTEMGEKLLPILMELEEWGKEMKMESTEKAVL
jgi:DNA-binding HxlR family transcriptional regulator